MDVKKRVNIDFTIENEAFEDPAEFARILKIVAERFENNGAENQVIKDINGNTVGFANFFGDK